MKRYLSIIIAGACLAGILPSCNGNGYTITGKAGNFNGKAVLSYTTPEGTAFIDTVALKRGTFRFKGSVTDVVEGRVQIIPDGSEPMSARLYVENSGLVMSFDMDKLVNYGRYGGLCFRDNNVSGGPNNEFDLAVRALHDSIGTCEKYAEMLAMQKQIDSIGFSDMAAKRAKIEEFQQKFMDVYEEYEQDCNSAMKGLIRKNGDVEAAGAILRRIYAEDSVEEFENGINGLSAKVQQSLLAKETMDELAARKATQVGAQAPDFTLKTPDGADFTLSSTRGKYVLVDFWASWCRPCRAGVPGLKELYKKYHPKGFEIVGVSDDNNTEEWKSAIAEDQSPWIHVIDEFPVKNRPARVGSSYGVHYIPTYFLLDKEGRVIGKMEHAELAAKLSQLLD